VRALLRSRDRVTVLATRHSFNSIADWPAVWQLLPVIERELSPFQPCPHWGKLFTLSPRDLRARYERLPEFLALAAKYDPKGEFRNDFLNTNLVAG
jgi:alditol oxidase